ncbi:MAG: hypothetical protein KatS3mg103_1102 [Phycisphaerales bacterium]|nr:MAG: hypothetical protein KatS3mg103_1102 [Phycisphaerales bacterium]
MRTTLATTVAWLAAAGLAGTAQAQLIDFEGLGQGTPVTTQYASQGVIFGTTSPDGPASISIFSGFFGSDVLCNATDGGIDRRLTLVMDFTTPITQIEFDFNSAGTPSSGFMFPIRFYSGGSLVLTDGLMENGSAWTLDIVYAGLSNVDRIEIDSASSSWLFGVDNMEFVQVPAPGSLALLGLGALAAGRRRR